MFAIGLGLSGMTDPTKVLAFLNFIDEWDSSLAFVMGVGVTLNLVYFHYILKQEKPVCNVKFSVPNNRVVDAKLVIGSCLFGAGWGLAGMCPGPAIVGIASGSVGPIVFVCSLIAAIAVEKECEKRKWIPLIR
eukprot:TRINITY_DN12908_c0_g1_i4.p1 TRINITY_DN12908_c0_g1~~TRINITY_DN12908_c0_g1_i4.p1  ORF type:complete len:133 (-),score=34.31 TRINITY_DN12908_c0_g1_i4:24-422(-)